MSRLLLGLLARLLPLACAFSQDPTPPTDPHRELQLLLRRLGETRRVLYVTAHPDDEDAGLLAKLAHGRGAEVLLLTLTRGEGGQNEIGAELGHALGVLRRRELQAAHRYDGAAQAFARAHDFGYSFSVEETLERWGRERILGDVVRVVRRFQPDVIVCLSPEGDGGGQHHQASGRIAIEAFERAADPAWHPELGAAHRTARLFEQVWDRTDERATDVVVDLGAYDPVLGLSWAEVEALSRAQHKCQGMVRLHPPFHRTTSRLRWRAAPGDEPRALDDPLEGLRRPLLEGGGAAALAHAGALRELAERIGRGQRSGLAFLVDELLEPAPEGPAPTRAQRETARERVHRLRELLSGVRVAARVARGPFVAAGETVRVELTLENTGAEPVDLDLHLVGPGGLRAPAWNGALAPRELVRASAPLALPADLVPTVDRAVPERAADGETPDLDPLAPAEPAFTVAGTLRVAGGKAGALRAVPVEHVDVRADFPSWRRAFLDVVPDPRLAPEEAVAVFPLGAGRPRAREVAWRLGATRAGLVEVVFEASAGFRVEPERLELTLDGKGDDVVVRTRVSATETTVLRGRLRASARRAEGPRASRRGIEVVDALHVRPGALLVDAEVQLVAFPCAAPTARRIGYVRGVDDRVPEALAALGVSPTWLDADDLLRGDLERFDVLVVGVRAYLVRPELRAAHARLLEWTRAGGTWIVLYQKFEWNADGDPFAASPHAPYPARVTSARITAEDAPVEVAYPGAALWQVPNAIGAEDWNGWVQERGLYFLEPRDSRYRDHLRFEDPFPFNAGPRGGALVEARVGEGTWLYCGLALFRQLRAGVPGAHRLLANLLSVGG